MRIQIQGGNDQATRRMRGYTPPTTQGEIKYCQMFEEISLFGNFNLAD